MVNIDSLLLPQWIIPIEPHNEFYIKHAVAVDKGRILDVLPEEEAKKKYQPVTTVYLEEHVVMPGLVNAHTHSPLVLLRGLADDLPFMVWLKDRIWPAENRWLDEAFCRDGMELALAEMLSGGTTCFQEHYFFPDILAEVTTMAQGRACLGIFMLNSKTNWAGGLEEYLDKGLQFYKQYKNEPLIKVNLAPHAPYSLNDSELIKIKEVAKELDTSVHMHVHESSAEIIESMQVFRKRPLLRLHDLGMFEVPFQCVHMVQLNDADIELMQANPKIGVIHCPESNLKLANGICPIQKLLKQDISVSIGTDSAVSNNDLDMFSEMRTAAMLAKGSTNDPTAVPAAMALRMATLNGARAIGLGQEIGSIEIGKSADFIAVNLSAFNTQPVYNPISQIVYAASSRQVSDVWIAGRRIMEKGELKTLDKEKILVKAKKWQEKIQSSI